VAAYASGCGGVENMYLGGASEKDIEELDEGNDLYDPGVYVYISLLALTCKTLEEIFLFLLSALFSVAVMRVLPQANCHT
jgi:hypothetical protein